MKKILEWFAASKYNLTVVSKVGSAELAYVIKTNDLDAFNNMVAAMEDKSK